jgi:hypothetical protein
VQVAAAGGLIKLNGDQRAVQMMTGECGEFRAGDIDFGLRVNMLVFTLGVAAGWEGFVPGAGSPLDADDLAACKAKPRLRDEQEGHDELDERGWHQR